MNRSIFCFLFCVFCFLFCVFSLSLDLASAEDNCDETCEQNKFDKVKRATSGLRETCEEMKQKIDSLEGILETLEDERKWTLAFKVEAGSHICVDCAWSSPATVNPQSYLEAIDLKKPCGCAFVNHEVLNNWEQHFQSKMTQVSLSFWNRTEDSIVRVASVLFDGRDSDPITWFKGSRVRDSSFEDLHDIRGLDGDDEPFQLLAGERTSFAMHEAHPKYCDDDDYSFKNPPATGWMMVAQKTPRCVADDPALGKLLPAKEASKATRFPKLIYTKERTAGAWRLDENLGYADLMTIFVR